MRPQSVQLLRRLFAAYVLAHSARTPALKRSKDDKEYFVQDWVAARADEAGCAVRLVGRNSYPDFWFTQDAATVGNEVKSLAQSAKGRPARPDVDFNSTAPRPQMDGDDCSLTFVLYQPVSASAPLQQVVTTICLADMALLNADPDFTPVNLSVSGFGSYGDGKIRNRRMYRFPQPVTIAAEQGLDIRARSTLIVPAGSISAEEARADDLILLAQLSRTPVSQRLASYEVDVRVGHLRPTFEQVNRHPPRMFDVWTAQGSP